MKTLARSPYTETLGQAVELAIENLIESGAEFDRSAIDERYAFDGVPYETTKQADVALISYKGKATKKWGHVSIYRMNSGRYEVTTYIL